MAKKSFTCYYYQPLRNNDNQQPYDFAHLVNLIDEHEEVWRIVQEYGDGHRLRINNIYSYDNNYQPSKLNSPLPYRLFHIVYTRIRMNDRPCVVNMNNPNIEGIPLQAGCNIGETVSVLYDPELNLILMQRNTHSVSKTGVERFLNQLLGEEEDTLTLAPLVKRDTMDQLLAARECRKFVIRLVDASDAETQNWAMQNPALGSVISHSDTMRGSDTAQLQYEIILGPTPNSKCTINMEAVRAAVNSALDLIPRGKISKLTAKVDTSKEPLNMINAILKESFKLDVPDDNLFLPGSVFDEMAYCYSRRREEMRRRLGV